MDNSMFRMAWPFDGPFGDVLTTASSSVADDTPTIEKLEETLRQLDPDGTRMATAKLLTVLVGLPAWQIDLLTQIARSKFFRETPEPPSKGGEAREPDRPTV